MKGFGDMEKADAGGGLGTAFWEYLLPGIGAPGFCHPGKIPRSRGRVLVNALDSFNTSFQLAVLREIGQPESGVR